MTEYIVEFQDQDTVLWSVTVTATSEQDAAEKAVRDSLHTKDLTGVHAFVYASSESIYESTSFNAETL